MLSFYQKRKWKNFLHSKFVLLALVLLCIPLGISVFERYQVEREMAERRLEMEAERTALELRKAKLNERVRYLEDERGVEAEIRRHFDVAKEGEQVVIIYDDETKSAVATSGKPAPSPEPWYMFWR